MITAAGRWRATRFSEKQCNVSSRRLFQIKLMALTWCTLVERHWTAIRNRDLNVRMLLK